MSVELIGFEWYKGCVELAYQYPTGSFMYCFWWGSRYELYKEEYIKEWAHRPIEAMARWLGYIDWKIDQLKDHPEMKGYTQ